MKKAVVIGANGQDGSFLVRHLLKKGYAVLGVGRQESSPVVSIGCGSFSYLKADLEADNALSESLSALRPDLIFHVAAVHTSAGGEYETVFDRVLKVNVGSVHTVLEYLRQNKDASLMYASSAKVFGSPLPAVIDERTPKLNQCLYSISKNSSFNLIDYYRRTHGVKASAVYLFNHESELRPDSFFIPKVLDCLSRSLKDKRHRSELYTLDFHCDWGSAEEYMEIAIEMLERFPAEDYVLATGACTYARDLVRDLFQQYGLDYRDHLVTRESEGCAAANSYRVDHSKLRSCLGRVPTVAVADICLKMLKLRHLG